MHSTSSPRMNGCDVPIRSSTVAVRATLLYLFVSVLWIWFFDQALVLLFNDVQTLFWAQTSKGWIFVALTSVALFTLLHREMNRYERTSDSLRTSEQYLGSIFRAAPVGIGMVRNRVIITVNDRLCAMTGYERGELVGHSSRLLYPDDAEFDAVGVAKYEQIAQHGAGTVVTRWARKDGSILHILLSSSPLVIGDLLSGVTFTAVDITASKQVEQELREREKRYRSLIDLAVDGILLCDHEGIIVDGNAAMCALLGMERSVFIGGHLTTLPFAESDATADWLHANHPRPGQTVICERMLAQADGSQLSLEMRTTMMPDGSYQSIFRDITRRKQAEADLERLKVAIEQAGEAVVITDVAGAILYANPAFSHVTGYAREEVLQQNPRILKSGEHDETFYEELWRTIASGRTWSGRVVNKKKDGTLYTEEATISPVFDQQGSIVNYVAIKRDITAQLKLEAQYLQAQKMESVGRLTGGVAHDFNNILAVITGYCEMAMVKAAPGQPVYSDLERIHEAALRSADIIRQLLAFSRKQAIIPKIIDLNELVAGMLKMLHRMIGEGIELIWSPAANLPSIKMDPAQIDQVLANLCVNGRDALDGSGAITLRTGRVELDADYCAELNGITAGAYVVLTVSDNGCGMEPEVREKIFEPFFTTKGVLGTGLGLSTVYGIVKQNHGHVEVQSEPGQGTTFFVYLPAHVDSSVPVMESEPEPPPLGRGETVLLVEDDASVLALGRAMLESLGYTVLAAATPGEAMLLAKQADKRIDLLLTDVIMPTMNGKELADRLTVLRPTLKVLFMSGYAADVITEKATLASNASFLQKPFSIKSLADRVRSVLAP